MKTRLSETQHSAQSWKGGKFWCRPQTWPGLEQLTPNPHAAAPPSLREEIERVPFRKVLYSSAFADFHDQWSGREGPWTKYATYWSTWKEKAVWGSPLQTLLLIWWILAILVVVLVAYWIRKSGFRIYDFPQVHILKKSRWEGKGDTVNCASCNMGVDCPCEDQLVSTTVIGLTISTSLLLMACLYLYVRSFASWPMYSWTLNSSSRLLRGTQKPPRSVSLTSRLGHLCRINSFTYLQVSISQILVLTQSYHRFLAASKERRRQGSKPEWRQWKETSPWSSSATGDIIDDSGKSGLQETIF